jgi:hypothetical protein
MDEQEQTLEDLAASINARFQDMKRLGLVRGPQKHRPRRCGGVELGADWQKQLVHCKTADVHLCPRCDGIFAGTPGVHYCSPACQEEAAREQRRRSRARIGKRRAARRAELSSRCAHCQEPMPSCRSSKRYCSVRCRVAAHRGRKAIPVVIRKAKE